MAASHASKPALATGLVGLALDEKAEPPALVVEDLVAFVEPGPRRDAVADHVKVERVQVRRVGEHRAREQVDKAMLVKDPSASYMEHWSVHGRLEFGQGDHGSCRLHLKARRRPTVNPGLPERSTVSILRDRVREQCARTHCGLLAVPFPLGLHHRRPNTCAASSKPSPQPLLP
jgi:hypothetical protein